MIEARNLVKWYGPRLAVRDVSFSVADGEVVGLLGPNGSGKSTIFRMLTGFIAPSSGSARVAGYDTGSESPALRRAVGYVPEDAPLYEHMRVSEFLRFMARLKGLPGKTIAGRIADVAARLQLEKVLNFPAGKLSRGYRQRVSVAQALLNEPKLLVLDEPTSGLDPSQVIAVRELIRGLAGRQTVLIASHVLSEIEQIADRVMILLDGKLLTTNALAEGAASRRLRVAVAAREADAAVFMGALPGVRSVSHEPGAAPEVSQFLVETDQRSEIPAEIAAALVSAGFALRELSPVAPDLERIFLDLTHKPLDAAA